ncbi:MAG: hypothetical protein KKE76_09145 [Gammaproteobacteria bacterium]|nr:hypothetical protein [Gammaproteobacteria bacterium]
MSTLTVKRDSNLKDIEEMLYKIERAETDIALRLPNSLKYAGSLGIEATVIQLISTWLRKHEGRAVYHSYIKEGDSPSEYSELCSKMYGIQILSLADKLMTEKLLKIKRRVALQQAVQRIDDIRSLNFSNAFKGPYLGFPLIKAPGNTSELNSPFYNKGAVVDRNRFLRITEDAIRSVLKKNSYDKAINRDVLSNITSIIYELFTNTDKHARRDELGNILPTNFRCVLFSSISLTEGRLDDWVSSWTDVMFAANWKERLKVKPQRVLEISVIDSGPGFARRWKGVGKEALTIEDQKEAVLSCFKKYRTTDINSAAGSGLSNVLWDLRKLKGWFRLRTGNLVVEKWFHGEAPTITTDVTKEDLWEKKAFAEGAAITFLIPLVE